MDAAMPDMEAIFDRARALPERADRTEYLDEARGAQGKLRVRVEALLKADRDVGDFLHWRDPEPSPVPAGDVPGSPSDPTFSWRRLREGGFGVVYRAEQEGPLRRNVALKVLKPGMDTRQVVARFEQEMQALALMDHPGIAKVIDAGETPFGRPYFVLERVRGDYGLL